MRGTAPINCVESTAGGRAAAPVGIGTVVAGSAARSGAAGGAEEVAGGAAGEPVAHAGSALIFGINAVGESPPGAVEVTGVAGPVEGPKAVGQVEVGGVAGRVGAPGVAGRVGPPGAAGRVGVTGVAGRVGGPPGEPGWAGAALGRPGVPPEPPGRPGAVAGGPLGVLLDAGERPGVLLGADGPLGALGALDADGPLGADGALSAGGPLGALDTGGPLDIGRRLGAIPGEGLVGVAPDVELASGAEGRTAALPGGVDRTEPWVGAVRPWPGAAGRPRLAAGGRPGPPCGVLPAVAAPGQGGGASTLG
ncbi:hypothetical protein V6V47_05395 [Micromonospora sp. CPCC 205539]